MSVWYLLIPVIPWLPYKDKKHIKDIWGPNNHSTVKLLNPMCPVAATATQPLIILTIDHPA